MGKKKQTSSLGKSIIRDRFGKKDRKPGDTFLHTADLQDGYDWGRLNLQSVTEQNNLDDFLATAELAGTEFTAEKLNVKFVSSETGCLPHAEELKTIEGLHKQHENLLRIPRRPHWSTEMSASEVDQNERSAFLDWRRSLASLQEDERIVMTPYEKNLDFWRQLWRVIERSDIVVQIVDARNPLLFYCADLEAYVKEVDKSKICMVLINKADFLTLKQREDWAKYFTSKGIRVAFWSAVEETARQELAAKHENVMENIEDLDIKEELASDSGNEEEANNELVETSLENDSKLQDNLETDSKMEVGETDKLSSVHYYADGTSKEMNKSANGSCDKLDITGTDCKNSASCGQTSSLYRDLMKNVELKNTSMIYTGPELLELFKSIHIDTKVHEGRTTVGMVGYPNVGKSSTINAILKMKKVPVSATPGRTKHFQTLYVDPTLMLCDCPGLVFPSFVTTKADLVLGGILPIDQMRDFISPTALLCQKIPRWLLERTYGICLPKPMEGEDPDRPPSAHELLNTYGAMRGFMTSRGQPDGPRSARYLLKDYVNGKLLHCQPPPDIDPEEFNEFKEKQDSHEHDASSHGTSEKDELPGPSLSKMDTEFFKKEFSTVHQRTARGEKDLSQGSETADSETSQVNLNNKPWKKHKNKNKREKLRRVYEYLDK